MSVEHQLPLHVISRPWPNHCSPLVTALSGTKPESSERLFHCTLTQDGIWDIARLLDRIRETCKSQSHRGLVHIWNSTVARRLLPHLMDEQAAFVIQLDSENVQINTGDWISAYAERYAVRFILEDNTSQEVSLPEIAEGHVISIPAIPPPGTKSDAAKNQSRSRWRLDPEDLVIVVPRSDIPESMYAVTWASFLAHEAESSLRIVLAAGNREQRHCERMADGSAKQHICRFINQSLTAEELLSMADLLVLPIGYQDKTIANLAEERGLPVLDVQEVYQAERPDDNHPFHDLAQPLLAHVDGLSTQIGNNENDHATELAAWSQQVSVYQRVYADLVAQMTA